MANVGIHPRTFVWPRKANEFGWWHIAVIDDSMDELMGVPAVIFKCLKLGTRDYVEKSMMKWWSKMPGGPYSLIIVKWKWWHQFLP